MTLFQCYSCLFVMLWLMTTTAKELDSCLNILITNDDGYETLLTNTLFKFLRDETCHNVKMVAPKGPQSGKSGSIDLFVPFLEEGNPEPDIFFLDSTPVTTVLYGIDVICQEANFKPDLVLSGPNEGWNIGWITHNSGTVNAAVTAMTKGYPAIALSASTVDAEFEDAALVVAKIVNNLIEKKLLENGELILGMGEGLNVNIPTVTDSSPVVNDYQFELTTIGRSNPIGGAQYFRDLKDSNFNTLLLGGALNGLSGLGLTIPYNAAGYPTDDDPNSEGNVFGDIFNAELKATTVTVSPIEFSFAAKPSYKLEQALGVKESKSAKKAKKSKSAKTSKNSKKDNAKDKKSKTKSKNL